jgi:thioredoxin reductase
MHRKKPQTPDIAIIGGGPAGISTAIQLRRFDLEPVIFEKERLGGLLWNARKVENYPGFHEAISGADLVHAFQKHLDAYHVPVIKENVKQVSYNEDRKRFRLETTGAPYEARFVVIATGTTPKTGGFKEKIPTYLHPYLYFEIYPLLKEKAKKILVIGAGDIAFDYALHLPPHNTVTIVHRGPDIKALPLLGRAIQDKDNISFIDNTVLERVEKGNSANIAVTLRNETGQTLVKEVDYLVAAVGREPQTQCIANAMKNGIIDDLAANGQLYFAGDVQNGRFRQVAIAAGNGIETAMKIHEHWLRNGPDRR